MLYAFFALFLSVGLGILGFGVRSLLKSNRVEQWPTTWGALEQRELVESSDSDGSTWRVQVRYRYRVAGIEHMSDRLAFGYVGSSARETHQAILDKHVTAALKKRDSRDELTLYTKIDPGHPRRFPTRVESEGGFDVVPEPFASALPAMLDEYRKVRRGGPGETARFAIKSAAQRFGTGISSFANLRFWVLIENGPGDDDDLILELKEERDPPEPPAPPGHDPGPPPPPPPPPDSNGARVFDGARRLLSSGGMDPDLGYVNWGGVSFQVRRETAV